MSEAVNSVVVRRSWRRRLRHVVMLLLGPAVIAGVSAIIYLNGGRYVSTDNAYIRTDILAVSANVSGMVTAVAVRESQQVSPGELLLRVDDQPYLIALARAQANLANVRGDIESLKAEFVNKQLEIAAAETDLEYRQHEFERLRALHEQNSISGVQFDQAVYARQSAERELAEKKQALQVVKARLVDPDQSVDAHPRVLQALAEIDKAQLDLRHTEVRAPAGGVIAGISAHVGENVISGAPLMNLVDRSHLWIEANFKETDLTYLDVGQPVEVSIDTYADRSWHGHVAVITPATGAEFSLLPAQNSSGNWIKVVQRVPVLVMLDDYDGTPLLASGMSAEIRVDTGHIRSLPIIVSR